MQRAIRLNTESPQLYFEYCRLELLYLQKLRARIELTKKLDTGSNKGIGGKDESKNEAEEGNGEVEEGINLDSLPDKKGYLISLMLFSSVLWSLN